MYSGDPANSKTDQVRLVVGDIWCDIELLKDADYQFFLDKYNGNVNRASIDAARTLLFVVARFTREKTGDIEVYGDAWAKNYRQALLLFINNPNLVVSVANPWAGGISKKDMHDNDHVRDNVRPKMYIGFTDTPYRGWWEGGSHLYQDDFRFDTTFKI